MYFCAQHYNSPSATRKPPDLVLTLEESCRKCSTALKLYYVRLTDEIAPSGSPSRAETQTTSKLLQEHSQTLCGTQEHNSIDLRDIHTLVVQVNCENELYLAIRQITLCRITLVFFAVGGQGDGRDIVLIETQSHILSVLLRYAEAQSFDLVHVRNVFVKLFQMHHR